MADTTGGAYLPPVVVSIALDDSAALAKLGEFKAAMADTATGVGASTGAITGSVDSAEKDIETRSGSFSSKIAGIFTSVGSSMGSFGIPFSKAVTDMGSKIEEAEKHGSGFKESMLQIGKTATAVSGVALVGFGAESVKMAMDYEKANSILETAVKNSGGSFAALKPKIDAAQESSRKLGFTDTESAEALAKLVTATGSTSVATEKMGLVEDLARYKHISLAEAAGTLAKVYAGSNRALTQLGLQTTLGSAKLSTLQTATQSVESAQIGLQKTTREVEEGTITGAAASEKMEEAHRKLSIAEQKLHQDQGAVTEALGKLQDKLHGTADAYGNTLAGKIDVAKASVDHIAVAFGSFLIPILSTVLSTVANVVTWFANGGTAAHALAAVIAGPLAIAVGYFVTTKLIALGSYVVDAVAALGKLGMSAVEAATSFGTATGEMEVAEEGLAATSEETGVATSAAFGPIGLAIAAIVIAVTLLLTHWRQVWGFIETIVTGAVNFVKQHFMILLAVIATPIAAMVLLYNHWKEIWAAIESVVRTVVHAIGSVMSAAWNTIKGAATAAWNAIKNVFSSAWHAIETTVGNGIHAVIGFFTSLPGKVLGVLGGLVSKMKELGSNLIHALISGITSAPGAIINAIKGLIPGSGLIGKAASIIGLAEGGLVTAPTLAVVGEAGPEMVVPLSKVNADQNKVRPLSQAGPGGFGNPSASQASSGGVGSGLHVDQVQINGANQSNADIVNEMYQKLRPLLQGA